ncbi:M3 family metallopeptidase [Candidatus Avelusimicrobium fimicolum]|jgi:thimet oligopeptidase|uniref:M3 family metallopeptidase n=1 Tax=Candidatus Avelusimicrobium fimicolum TaxID=3416216 RepID=UPI003D0D7369
MKKTKLLLVTALLLTATGAFSMADMFNKDGVLHFNYQAQDLAPAEAAARVKLEKDLAALIAIPQAERTFENTIMGYERAFDNYGNALGMSGFLSYVSTDKQFRDAANDLQMQISQYMVDVATRRDVYKAIREYTDTNPRLDPVQAKLVKEMLIGFKNSGMDLNDADLEKFKALNKEKAEYIIKFDKNIQEYKDPLAVTQEQLQGLGEDYIQKLSKTDDGKYLVTLDYPDYVPFMQNADDEQARKELEFKFNRRGGQENVELLEKTLTLRREIARLLGYKNHAELRLEDRMAKNPKTVMAFLKDLQKKLKPLGKKEDKEMIAYKNSKTGKNSRTLYSWESGYWSNKFRKENLELDSEKIKEYFPSQVVIDGMLDLFGGVFGITFEPVDIPVWHPDVKAFKIKDKASGELVAYFYMDLYPREGKYKHAACFGLVEGEEKQDGTYQIPFVAIVANLNKPSGDTPSLLKHSEVETLFHEFGHVLHNALTKAKYSAFSGTSVSWDFVEAPSQMLERWAWDPQVLKKISKHYKTGEALPDDLIKRMIAAKNFGAGGMYLRQDFFAQYDMTLHTADTTPDTTKLYFELTKKIRGLPLTKGTIPQASFGHIMGGYDAGYYGYLWSEVIAEDFFGEFKKNGIFNPETGLKFRREILEKGGTLDEEKMVENFLGRPADNKPFLKSIGLENL